MSTDDFEQRLRARLADLADHEDDWDDPLPGARRRAAAGAPHDTVDVAPLLPRRRRLLPGLAVAAVLLALVVGGGLGVRELVRGGGGTGTAGSAADMGVAPAAGEASQPTGAPSARPGGADTAGCAAGAAATSTGPLADVAAVRPSGTVGPRTTSGGTVAVAYQLSFTRTGADAQVRAAYAAWVDAGQLCGRRGTAQPDHIQIVPVTPGAGVSGTATFTAVDSDGRSLPAGQYQLAVVIPYSVAGSGLSVLVSAPVSVEVAP